MIGRSAYDHVGVPVKDSPVRKGTEVVDDIDEVNLSVVRGIFDTWDISDILSSKTFGGLAFTIIAPASSRLLKACP